MKKLPAVQSNDRKKTIAFTTQKGAEAFMAASAAADPILTTVDYYGASEKQPVPWTVPAIPPRFVASAPTPDSAEFGPVQNMVFNVDAAPGQVVPVYAKLYPQSDIVAYPKGWLDTSKNGTYDPAALSVHDGVLDMHATWDATTQQATVAVLAFFGWADDEAFGAFEIEYWTTTDPTLKFIWMIWANGWKWEVDAGEVNLGALAEDFLHTANNGAAGQISTKTTFDTNDRHVLRIEWTPTRLTVLQDGVRTLHTVDAKYIYQGLAHVLGQLESTLDRGVEPGPKTDGHVYITRATKQPYRGAK